MSHHRTRTLKLTVVCVGIFLAGGAVGAIRHRARANQLRADLADHARRAAVAFDPAQLRQLSATAGDLKNPAYVTLQQRLRKLQAVQPELRFLCLFRFLPASNRLLILADSAPGVPAGGSTPGDEYPAARYTPALRQIQATGETATEGPRFDALGTWVTVYALVDDPSAGDGGARDILRLDLDAARWRQAVWQSAFQGAFYTWVMLGLPLVVVLISRRQGEQREVIRNLSQAIEQSHSAVMIADLEGRIEFANRGVCQQLGYSRRELLGRDWRELRAGGPGDAAHAELLATMRAGKPWEGEWLNQRKDGTAYPVHGVVSPVKHPDGSLSCQVVVFDDATETKRTEAELREARDLAEAGDRAKGQFLATMSHEVRTPLNGIVGFTSLLFETPLSAEQRDYVQTIRMSTEALIQLTGDILDFARIDSGKLKLDPLACDPRECIEDALDLLANKAAEKKLELLHHIDDGVPAAVVVDGGRLRQVLVNLVGNAVKFTEHGEVEVRLGLVRREGAGAAADDEKRAAAEPPAGADAPAPGRNHHGETVLEFSVRDTGIGIAAAYQAKLFKPFTQADDSSTRRYGGTGLGLAINRNLVRLMGGDIAFTSTPGAGSVFSFTIVGPVAAPYAPKHALPSLCLALVAQPGALRRELASLLRSWQAEVIEVSGPEELAGRDCHATIVDLDEKSAGDLASTATAVAGIPAGRAVALVPVTLSSDRRASLRTHFRSLLNKPVHHDALFSVLSGSRTDTPLTPAPPTHFGFRVLVVEDNRMNQRLMERTLRTLGCNATVVENGRLAVTELTERAQDYDVVLLDLHMPDMDGLTALKEIRRGGAGLRAQTMWMIALTADARDVQRARALAAGVNDYLTKPVNLGQVEAALKRFRAERSTRRH
ncbi:MAG: ATP-binding protein [Opitutaceae bacterium]|nr:ATP-binding protein [Opitutaceae bacterium]